MLLDPSVPEQKFIEDCEVCCRPIDVYYRVENDEIAEFDAGGQS